MAIFTILLILIIIATDLWSLYLIWRRWHSFSQYPPEILQPFIQDEDYKRLDINTLSECTTMAAVLVLKLTIKVLKLTLSYQDFVWNSTLKFADDDISRAAWFVVLDVLITLSIEKPFETLGLLFLVPEEHHKLMDHLGQSVADIGAATILAGIAARCAVFIVERFGVVNLMLPALLVEFSSILLFAGNVTIWLPLIARPLSVIYETEIKIRALANDVGFPEKKVLVDVTKGRPPTTYYFGVFGRCILVINWELIMILTPGQALALVSHELGRWRYRHSTYRLMITVGEMMLFSVLSISTYYSSSVDGLFGFTHGKGPHPLIRSYLARYFIWPSLLDAFKGPLNIFMAKLVYQADEWVCSRGYGEDLKAALLTRECHLDTPEFDNLYVMWVYGKPTVIERVRKINSPSHSFTESDDADHEHSPE